MSPRKALALLVAPALLVIGLDAGVASAHSATATVTVLPDGTRVTGSSAAVPMTTYGGNPNASVDDVPPGDIGATGAHWAYIDPYYGTPCPSGHFCIYTDTHAHSGVRVFSFYNCTAPHGDWTLRNWVDAGFYDNENFGGAHGYLEDYPGHTHSGGNIPPGASGSYDFYPINDVKAC
ncbi:MAG: hypothetical protein JF587_11870 [Catenulisporales bacterium]|nr:hypothetical protein [Catenulisporales bacterium]